MLGLAVVLTDYCTINALSLEEVGVPTITKLLRYLIVHTVTGNQGTAGIQAVLEGRLGCLGCHELV